MALLNDYINNSGNLKALYFVISVALFSLVCLSFFWTLEYELKMPLCLECNSGGDLVYLPLQLCMQGIADTISCLQREGRLLQGEHNLIGEAFLVMASSAG